MASHSAVCAARADGCAAAIVNDNGKQPTINQSQLATAVNQSKRHRCNRQGPSSWRCVVKPHLQCQQHQVCAKHGAPAAPEATQAAREGLMVEPPDSILRDNKAQQQAHSLQTQ